MPVGLAAAAAEGERVDELAEPQPAIAQTKRSHPTRKAAPLANEAASARCFNTLVTSRPASELDGTPIARAASKWVRALGLVRSL